MKVKLTSECKPGHKWINREDLTKYINSDNIYVVLFIRSNVMNIITGSFSLQTVIIFLNKNSQ